MNSKTSSLVEILDELPELRPFPAVASRVLAMCNDEDADVMELSEIMQCDPAMSVRLLQIANGSQFGFGGKIASVEHAIVVLGYRAVRNLALSIAAQTVFSEGAGARQWRQRLWQHSLGCAAVGRQLAQHVSRIPPDEAFLAGIMHDVGKLVFFDLVPEDYALLLSSNTSQTIIAAEHRGFGTTHQQVGERCGQQWGLPPEINAVISSHHEPQSAESFEELVALISAANHLAHAWKFGSDADTEEACLDADVAHRLGIDDELLAQLQQEVPAEYEALCQTCAR